MLKSWPGPNINCSARGEGSPDGANAPSPVQIVLSLTRVSTYILMIMLCLIICTPLYVVHSCFQENDIGVSHKWGIQSCYKELSVHYIVLLIHGTKSSRVEKTRSC